MLPPSPFWLKDERCTVLIFYSLILTLENLEEVGVISSVVKESLQIASDTVT